MPATLSYYPLRRALGLSLVLHAAVLGMMSWLPGSVPHKTHPLAAALSVRLEELPPRPAASPVLVLPQAEEVEPVQRPARVTPVRTKQLERASPDPATALQVLSGDAARIALDQVARELLYPPEAIERGLEGEALVLLFLDSSGNAIAARLEASSGHALLDNAAVRAARTLRSLPAGTPAEALLPVRFRLR